MTLIGIDIGGTKVTFSLADGDGTVHAHRRIATKTLGGPDTGLPKLIEEIGHVLRDENYEVEDIRAVGLAVLGPISTKTEEMVSPPNLPEWKNVPIVQFFREKLGCYVFMNVEGPMLPTFFERSSGKIERVSF